MNNICEMLEKSAERFPDKTAFTDPVNSITFRELLDKSRACACFFIKNHLINPDAEDTSVLFFMDKSVNCLPAMFGAVYSNAFYTFVDTRQTQDRVRHIIDTVMPDIIITNTENTEQLKSYFSSDEYALLKEKIMLIDDILQIAAGSYDASLLAAAHKSFYSSRILYVNFTSGSTGMPKGVAVGHASVIDFIEVFTKTFNISDDEIIANQAPFDFDVSVKDIYSGLYTGATVTLIPRSYFSQPTVLMDYLYDNHVTTLIWAVTAMCFVSIMNGFEYKRVDTIRKVMFSGEVMPVKQLKKWQEYLPNAMYVNLYGPTEITCNCTYHIVDKNLETDDTLPIGKPFENEKVFLLDENQKVITAPGIEGEICVCGQCLALGYYKDASKTQEAFTVNPANTAVYERMYHTGDLGKYDENGLLYYTSRKDFQIKHMGQRIELGDIENSAMSIDGVSRTCCIYDFSRKKILLFYTGSCDESTVKGALKDKLPQFMVPGKTTHLDDFPMNKNGKIDRKALESLK